MKKSVLALAMAFGVTSAFAQDLTSKKGEPILPEAGDWAVSADATPFLNYFGRLFNGANNAPTFNFLNGKNNFIMGKYFKDEKTAFRVGLNIGYSNQSKSHNVNQDQQPAHVDLPAVQVTDKASFSSTGIGLTVGIEKRKGKTRLQGYYGADFAFFISSQNQTNTYGNSMQTGAAAGTSITPTSTNFNPIDSSMKYGVPSYLAVNSNSGVRTTSEKSGTTFQIGIRGFVGVEYFILPKMSLGGEFGWGLGFSTTSSGSVTQQQMNAANTSAISMTTKTAGSSNFVLGTDNKNSIFGPVGSIRMNFYF
jgi:hypothetical protein